MSAKLLDPVLSWPSQRWPAVPAAADARQPVVHELTSFAAPGCAGGWARAARSGPTRRST